MAQFPPVAEQMRILMRGVDFGDAQTYTNMEKELRERLQESYDSGRPLASTAATTRPHPTCTWATQFRCANCASSRTWATTSPF